MSSQINGSKNDPIHLHNLEPSTSSFNGSNLSKNINNFKDGLPNLSLKTELTNNSDIDIHLKLLQLKELFFLLTKENKVKIFAELLSDLKDESILCQISKLAENQLHRVLSYEEPFSRLPRHVSLKILEFLDPKSLCSCMQVSRLWYELSIDQTLWRSLCHRPSNYRLSLEIENEHLRANTSKNGAIHWRNAFSKRYRLWRNWHAGRCVIRTFVGHDQGVSCVQLDDQRIISGSSDSTIRIWDLKTNNHGGSLGQMTLTGHSATVRCLHLNNNRLASGSYDMSIKIWDLSMNSTWSHIACRRTLLGHRNVVRCLQMADEKIVSGSYDQTLKIWSIDTGQCLTTLQGALTSVLCLQYARCDNRIVSGLDDSSIRCWDERIPYQCAMTLHNAHDDSVTCLRFDSEKIVSGSVDRTIKMWDLRTGKCLQTIDWKLSEGHTGVVRCLQTDSWRIVSAADDKTIKIWTLNTGERLCTLQGHTDGVTCTQFNDNRIVSGSYDKTVKLWDFSIC